MTPNTSSQSATPSIPLPWVIALAAAWILPGLLGHDPWKPDEGYTFGLVYSLLNGGDWIVPMLAGEAFMESRRSSTGAPHWLRNYSHHHLHCMMRRA